MVAFGGLGRGGGATIELTGGGSGCCCWAKYEVAGDP